MGPQILEAVMTFSEALERMKNHDAEVSRKSWPKGDWVYINRLQHFVLPHFLRANKNGDYIPWTPSHDDLLADDWFIVTE